MSNLNTATRLNVGLRCLQGRLPYCHGNFLLSDQLVKCLGGHGIEVRVRYPPEVHRLIGRANAEPAAANSGLCAFRVELDDYIAKIRNVAFFDREVFALGGDARKDRSRSGIDAPVSFEISESLSKGIPGL